MLKNKNKPLSGILIIILSFILLYTSNNQVNANTSKATETIQEVFIDKNLAQVIAKSLNKSIDDAVTQDELDSINLVEADSLNIEKIKGIERLNNLSVLNLINNKIKDLTPLSLNTFPKLYIIQLINNQIENIAPLKNLESINQVFLSNNYISNVMVVNDFKSKSLANFYIDSQKIDNVTLDKTSLIKRKVESFVGHEYDSISALPNQNGNFNNNTGNVEWQDLSDDVNNVDYFFSSYRIVGGGTWVFSGEVFINLKQAQVNVRYLDQDGNKLSDQELLKGTIDKPYTTTSKTFAEYTLTKTPVNAQGVFKAHNQTVTYIYTNNTTKPNSLKVKTKHIYNGKSVDGETKSIKKNSNVDLNKWSQLKFNDLDYTLIKVEVKPKTITLKPSDSLVYKFNENIDYTIVFHYQHKTSDKKKLPETGNELPYISIALVLLSTGLYLSRNFLLKHTQ